jgi:hypothetical protein
MIRDHKPLQYIMPPGKAVAATSAPRLQRWCLLLGAFRYEIECRSTKQRANCDELSRLPLPSILEDGEAEELLYTAVVENLPVTVKEVRRHTWTDPVLVAVLPNVKDGWPAEKPEELKPFYHC